MVRGALCGAVICPGFSETTCCRLSLFCLMVGQLEVAGRGRLISGNEAAPHPRQGPNGAGVDEER
jgi:hypothetical protein